jgi:signal transduction histidine kinase
VLSEFLLKNQQAILTLTEKKTLELAGIRSSSVQLRRGLPIFYAQLMGVLRRERSPRRPEVDSVGISDEPDRTAARGQPEEAAVARNAGAHGVELHRLGYTLSHVVHAYGAMCQAITELATERGIAITADEFHDLNWCLDVAIAGAVTEFQSVGNAKERSREIKHLGFLAHELRNALAGASLALVLIKRGTVGFGGNTGRVLDRSLERLKDLIDRSLTDVRMNVDPEIRPEEINLLQLVDEIVLIALEQARNRRQVLEIHVDQDLTLVADRQLFQSALSNLVQNAIKYSHDGGVIKIRGRTEGRGTVVEVEDECGGLTPEAEAGLFKPFMQAHENRSGLGLGLAISRRAIQLNHGTIEVRNRPDKGCVMTMVLPHPGSGTEKRGIRGTKTGTRNPRKVGSPRKKRRAANRQGAQPPSGSSAAGRTPGRRSRTHRSG